MRLVYINKLGINWEELYVYEFLFAEDIKDVDGDAWDRYPASGQPSPPKSNLINKVGVLTSVFKLTLIQDSDTFAVWDAVDGLISIGWENIFDLDEYPEDRIHFKYGETIETVTDKLYSKDLKLKFIENED